MATPDFRLQPDAQIPDFTLGADEADSATADQSIIKLDASIGLPEFEQMIGQTKQRLIDDGFDPADVESLVTPFQLEQGIPEHLDLNDIYDRIKPVLEENASAIEETWKINAQIEADGMTMGPFEWSAMRRMIGHYGRENLSSMAEARTFWQRLKRNMGDKFADATTRGSVNWGMGMALLDVFSFANKKFKLQFVPKDQRAELEERVLPSITLEDGKQYQLGTTAAWDLFTQRAYSGIEKFSGTITQSVGSMFGSATLGEMGEAVLASAQEREEGAVGQVPALVSALGERLSWQEVVERNWDQVTDVDSMYESFDDMGAYGDIAMGAIALGDGIAEMAFDPLLIIGGVASKVSPLGRAALLRAAPGKAAQLTSGVARRTQRFEDAVDAVKAAEAHVARVEKVADSQAGATGGQISMENARKMVLARKQLAREKLWLANFEDAGASEPILRRTARRNPELIPKTRTELAYLEGKPTGTMLRNVDDIADELRQTRRLELQREVDTTIDWDKVDDLPLFSQRQLLGPDDAEQAGDALNHMVRTGGVGIDDVAITSGAPELKLVPDSQIGLIDWTAIDKANQATKAERQFLSTAGARQLDLGSSTRRSLARQLDVVRRNLGLARERGDKAAIQTFTNELNNVKGTIKTMGKQGLLPKAKTFDDAWLPPSQQGILQDPGRFNSWLDGAGDRAMRSLYPGGLGLNALGDTAAGQVFAPFREPQRFYEQYDPAMWDRVRSGYLRYQRESRAFYETTMEGAEAAGILKPRSKFNPAREFSPFKIDRKRNEQLFDLLDAPKDTDAWRALAASADEPMLALHDKVRATLDHASDLQGLSDTPRHLTGYMRHTFDSSQFAGGARPLEYIGLPGKADVFASHLLTRTGRGGYPRDAMLALDLYGRAMNRKLIVEPLYDDIIRNGSELAAKHNNPMFQTYANDLVAQLKGTPRTVGARVDEWLGGALNKNGKTLWRPGAIDRGLVGLSGMFWTGALPGNPRYPIMQIATGVATTSSRFGLFRTSKALWAMGTREGQAVNRQIGTYDNFLNILESDFGRKWSTFVAKRGYTVTPFGVMSTANTEEYIRGATALAAIDMHMTKMGISSWAEAKELGVANRLAFEALRSSEEVNHMFGALGRSPWATRTMSPVNGAAVAATQFLSFIPKQTEELVGQFNRDPGMIAQYLAMSGWMSRLAAEEMGVDITNYVGLGYGPESPDELTSPAVDAFLKGIDFLYEASPQGTPQGRSDATTRFVDALDGMVPMLVAFETAGKGSQRLISQEQTTAKGERSRALEFGELGDTVSVSAALRAISPAETEEVASHPSLGGDVLPTAFGQQAIRENLFRRGQQALRLENQRFLFDLTTTMRNFANAVDDGNLAEAEALEEQLFNEFGQVLASDSSMEKAIMAREISWTLRQLERAPDQVVARMVKIIREFGVGLKP